MDWDLAISRNREALLRIVAFLFVRAGLDEGGADTLPRHWHRFLLRILRPAESAVRRLIIVAARALVVAVRASARSGAVSAMPAKPAGAAAIPSFPLLDPLKRFDFSARSHAATVPRIDALGRDWSVPVYLRPPDPPARPEPSPDDPVDATSLCRRLLVLKSALDDLPGQARRLARWRARRDLAASPVQGANGRYRRSSPMRPGWPPGHRKRHRYDVDEVLRECHSLAVHARTLDSS